MAAAMKAAELNKEDFSIVIALKEKNCEIISKSQFLCGRGTKTLNSRFARSREKRAPAGTKTQNSRFARGRKKQASVGTKTQNSRIAVCCSIKRLVWAML